jgi:predicted GIY-YIG superfamily endonuclease
MDPNFEDIQEKKEKPSFVYLLVSSDNATYVGATVDLDHRLRQHNKEIKGGATATSIRVNRGETWTRAAHVSGFPDWKAALQFEWRWKQLTRKIKINTSPLERRMKALNQLVKLERSTTKALAYSEWACLLEIHFEIYAAKMYYEKYT